MGGRSFLFCFCCCCYDITLKSLSLWTSQQNNWPSVNNFHNPFTVYINVLDLSRRFFWRLSYQLCWHFLRSNLKVRLLLWPSLITAFNNENTQSTRMHAMIPLAKNLHCIKISLSLKSETSLAVYSHHVCSIVVLDDMGMTATFKKNHTHRVCMHYQYLLVMLIWYQC